MPIPIKYKIPTEDNPKQKDLKNSVLEKIKIGIVNTIIVPYTFDKFV
jgi:hypothetical protein